MKLVEPIIKIGKKKLQKRFPFMSKDSIPTNLELWMNESQANQVKKIMTEQILECNLFITSEKENEYVLNSDPQTIVRVIQREPAMFTAELDVVSQSREDYKKGFQKRVSEFSTIGLADERTLALIVIKPKDEYPKLKDPKDAIREGMRRTQRLSQFIYEWDQEEAPQHKITNAILDLISDAGFVRQNIATLSHENHLLSFGLVHKPHDFNYVLPVLLWYHNKELRIKKRGQAKWQSIADGLLDFKEVKTCSKKNAPLYVQWLNQEIETLMENSPGRFCCMFDATLRNNNWSQLANNGILQRETPFGDQCLFDVSRLDAVRLNYSDDVPYYDILVDGRYKANFQQGLFKERDGVYYSVGGKPDTLTGLGAKMIKALFPSKLIAKQRLLEIIIMGIGDGAHKDSVAELIHQLRDGNITFKKSVRYPYPMHLLKAVRKYWISMEGEKRKP